MYVHTHALYILKPPTRCLSELAHVALGSPASLPWRLSRNSCAVDPYCRPGLDSGGVSSMGPCLVDGTYWLCVEDHTTAHGLNCRQLATLKL